MAKVGATSLEDIMLDGKKRPPKLKTGDRTVSVRVDNYAPGGSPVMLDNSLILHHSPIERLSPVPPQRSFEDYAKSKVFFMNESLSPLSPEYSFNPRKQLRRSDTVHVHPTHLRKTPSFHMRTGSGGKSDEIIPMLSSPRNVPMRHNSVRHSYHLHPNVTPRDYLTTPDTEAVNNEKEISVIELERSPMAGRSSRRNCHMHRSFNEQQKRDTFTRRDSVKCHSLGDDIHTNAIEIDDSSDGASSDVKKFISANASLEGEIYRSRSNSRTNKDESFQEFIARQNSKKKSSIEQPVSPYIGGSGSGSFRKSLIQHANAHLLSPNLPYIDDFKPQKSPVFDTKKSYSLRCKHGRDPRENFRAKKSKSFVSDLEPPFMDYSGSGLSSPYRKESLSFTPAEAEKLYKASRKISSNLLLDNINVSPLNMDIADLNYDILMKTYQMNRQKMASSRKGRRKKSTGSLKSKKKADTDGDDADEDSDELNRKRKRIVCIVMTVFLALALFSVLAVLVTLTHSGVNSVQNQTQKYYTFARDTPLHTIQTRPTYPIINKDTPKHYN